LFHIGVRPVSISEVRSVVIVTSFVISESAKRVIPLSVGGIMGNSSWINWDS